MKFFLDYFPLVIFVGIYFYSGAEQPMYPAVLGLMIASIIQTIGTRLITGEFEKMHLWILVITLVLGGMTLAFRDPLFVQWKASIVAWIFAAVLLFRQLVSKKPFIQSMMQSALETDNETLNIPEKTWASINYIWPIGYIFFGFLNLYVAFNYSEAFWVKFKLFGLMGMTIALFIFTVYKLFPHIPKDNMDNNQDNENNNNESNNAETTHTETTHNENKDD